MERERPTWAGSLSLIISATHVIRQTIIQQLLRSKLELGTDLREDRLWQEIHSLTSLFFSQTLNIHTNIWVFSVLMSFQAVGNLLVFQ